MTNVNIPKRNEPNVIDLNVIPKLDEEITHLHKIKWKESKLPKFEKSTLKRSKSNFS